MGETTNFSNMIDYIRFKVSQNPDKCIITFLPHGESEEHHLTYAELDAQARALAVELARLAAVGDRAVLLYPPGLELIVASISCVYAGIVPIVTEPVQPGHAPEMLLSIVANAEPTLLLTKDEIRPASEKILAQYPTLRSLPLLATDVLVHEGEPENWQAPTLGDDALFYVNYTSGSTKLPRGIKATHRNAVQSFIRANYVPADDELAVSWLPQYHTAGLVSTTLTPLVLGLAIVFMPPAAFLERPVRWLQAISNFNGTLSTAPNFGYQLCVERVTPEECRGLDLSSWRAATFGMEPVRANTLEQFAAKFAPYGFRREAFRISYALSEAAGGGTMAVNPKILAVQRAALEQKQVVLAAPGAAESVAFVSNGAPMFKGSLVIVDPDSLTRCPSDQLGEVWISRKLAAEGYFNNATGTQETFNAYLADTNEGPFLRTGDLGFFQDGELYITGRLKDMIIIRGHNFYAIDIEHVAGQAHPALMPGAAAVFGVPVNGEEQIVIVHEVKPDIQNVDVAEISQAIRNAVGVEMQLPVHAITLLKAGSLPRTAVGKIQRYLARQQYLARHDSTS